MRTATMSWSGASVVSRLPRTKSASGIVSRRSNEASSTSASRLSSTGTPSAAGEALHRLPQSVPAFCT